MSEKQGTYPTAQQLLDESNKRGTYPTAQELLAAEAPQYGLPTSVGGIPTDLSPYPLPENQTRRIPRTPRTYEVGPSLSERAVAAYGIDTRSGLQNFGLRKDLGFSPNEAFTADYLKRKLSAQTGLPEDEVVRLGPNGKIIYFNPQSRRFTELEDHKLSANDLADFYGPAHTLAPATAGAIMGTYLGHMVDPTTGSWKGATALGGLGAFMGEYWRLLKGRDLGVHNMSDEDIAEAALKIGGIDMAASIGGEGVLRIIQGMRNIMSPTGITASDAEALLQGMQKNQPIVDEINAILSRGGVDDRLALSVAEQAEDEVSIAALDSVSSVNYKTRGQRAAEMKRNETALEKATKLQLGLDPEEQLIIREGAVGQPAQAAMQQEQRRLQRVADDSLVAAEDAAINALNQYGRLDRNAAGAEAKRIINSHLFSLEATKNNAYNAYMDTIGQLRPGMPGFRPGLEFTSNIKIPVTSRLIEAHNAAKSLVKQSALDKKTAGRIGLDKPTAGGHIDLAVLDEDIKVVRNLKRSTSGDINTRQIARVERELVALRNEWLARNRPDALRLLDQAETAAERYKDLFDRSVFTRILKPDQIAGRFTLDNTKAFLSIWEDSTGAAMRELVDVAKRVPGGLHALRETGYKVYAANVTPRGSNVIDRKLHDKFVDKYEDVLKQLYREPSFYRFGKFADNIAKEAKRAEALRKELADGPLGRLGGVAPENLGSAVFAKGISEADVKYTVDLLERYGPEAVASFRESVGREIWRRMTTDGNLSSTTMTSILEQFGPKLTAAMGDTFVRDMKTLRKAVHLARQQIGGSAPKSSNLLGKLARAFITPPLTRRGRFQTFAEFAELQAMDRALNAAMRDPQVLRAIIAQGNRDIRNVNVVALLSQIGAATVAMDVPLVADGPSFEVLRSYYDDIGRSTQ